MKYDLNKKPTRFAQRTLEAFSYGLFDLLAHKPIEEITVNALCEKTNYPRATFYNYFDDIYDLLNYCWKRMSDDIVISDHASLKDEERTAVLFERCYDYFQQYEKEIRQIMHHNPTDGRFVESMRHYIKQQIYQIIVHTPCSEKYNIPYELIAEHYSNTIQLMLEWCFLKDEQMTKDEALRILKSLLGGQFS